MDDKTPAKIRMSNDLSKRIDLIVLLERQNGRKVSKNQLLIEGAEMLWRSYAQKYGGEEALKAGLNRLLEASEH